MSLCSCFAALCSVWSAPLPISDQLVPLQVLHKPPTGTAKAEAKPDQTKMTIAASAAPAATVHVAAGLKEPALPAPVQLTDTLVEGPAKKTISPKKVIKRVAKAARHTVVRAIARMQGWRPPTDA